MKAAVPPGLTEAVRTIVLNPASALVVVATAVRLRSTGTSTAELGNPWGVGLLLWLTGYAAVRVALLGFVDGFVWLVGPKLSALPSRTGPKPVYQHRINALDITYLLVNSTIEFVFAQQIAHLLWHAPFITRAPSGVGLLNGPLAFWLLLVVDDMLYAPLHRFMHHHRVYRWVHKHHHRNTFPARGYIDAANEHPVEQISALTLHWLAVHIVAHTAGLHVAAVGAHFGVKALGACFNHTGYDVEIRFLGIDYSVRAHEMHHRKPQTNFAQYVMFWDRLMGTFRPYESGVAAAGTDAARRPEPDRLPAWADAAVEASVGTVTERAHSD
jgi:sterol desaturase/sphingolipid hydroxylase (fatty acid hydroxylase superfamily)